MIEQAQRAVKRIPKPMLRCKLFHAEKNVFAGIELMGVIQTGQLYVDSCEELSFADQFHALPGKIRSASVLKSNGVLTRLFKANATEPIN